MYEIKLIYDHYKDTFSGIKCNETKRDELFITLFILLLLLFLCSIMPNTIYTMIKIIINSKIENMILFSFDIIQTFLWIIIFYTTVKYFQVIVHINKGYEYLSDIEEQIDKKIKYKFCREGKQYLDKYPLLLDYIYQMYITIFPILFGILITFKIFWEWISDRSNLCLNIINTVIFILIMVLIVLYYIELHPTRLKKYNNKIQRKKVR